MKNTRNETVYVMLSFMLFYNSFKQEKILFVGIMLNYGLWDQGLR